MEKREILNIMVETAKIIGIVLLSFAILGGTALVLIIYGGETFEMEWEEIDANAPLKEKIEENFMSIQEIFFIMLCFSLFVFKISEYLGEKLKEEG